MRPTLALCGFTLLVVALAQIGCTREENRPAAHATATVMVRATPVPQAAAPPADEDTDELYVDLEAEPDEGAPPLTVKFTSSVDDGTPPLHVQVGLRRRLRRHRPKPTRRTCTRRRASTPRP